MVEWSDSREGLSIINDVTDAEDVMDPYLDHKHRERKYVCTLSNGCYSGQYLWRSQPRGRHFGKVRGGLRIRSGSDKIKASDACVAGSVNEDI